MLKNILRKYRILHGCIREQVIVNGIPASELPYFVYIVQGTTNKSSGQCFSNISKYFSPGLKTKKKSNFMHSTQLYNEM